YRSPPSRPYSSTSLATSPALITPRSTACAGYQNPTVPFQPSQSRQCSRSSLTRGRPRPSATMLWPSLSSIPLPPSPPPLAALPAGSWPATAPPSPASTSSPATSPTTVTPSPMSRVRPSSPAASSLSAGPPPGP